MSIVKKYPRTFSKRVRDAYRKKRVAQIEQQSRWSETDVDLLLTFCREFNLVSCDTEVPFHVFVALAFDARTPDSKVIELQEEVKKLAPVVRSPYINRKFSNRQ